MKKMLISIGALALSFGLLAGCDETKENAYNISEVVTITDVDIELTKETRNAGRGGTYTDYFVIYQKDSQSSEKIEIDYNVFNQIYKIKNVDKLSSRDEKKYDIVTDGNKIYMITQSNNRR